MSNAVMKSRFAPSPTGLMHVGNVRTALFNYLFALSKKGAFLLRIEDTDLLRSNADYDFALQQDMEWLGLHWQEGPGKDLGRGPYHQSKRLNIYNTFYQQLESQGSVYPCFCSETELALTRKIQLASGRPPRYPGTCRSLDSKARDLKLASGIEPTLRFRIPENDVIIFEDLVRGEQRFQTQDIGDFIIRRANRTAPFMFCSAIDDALMGVTHVLRGEDHLTNTPRQLLILRALSLQAPAYGHISLIVGGDGSPLSKRHGSRSIAELREQGYLAIAVNNYLARLGHYYDNEQLLTLDALAEAFTVTHLHKSPAKFNAQQLDYWQKQAVNQLSNTAFAVWIGKILELIPDQEKIDLFIDTVKPNILFPSDVAEWIRICFQDTLQYSEDSKAILKTAGSAYFETALATFESQGKKIDAIMASLQETLQLKGKALYQPLRVALTGHAHGPELQKLLLLMDQDLIKKRLQTAIPG